MRHRAHSKPVLSLSICRTREKAAPGVSTHRATARDGRKGITTFVTARRAHFHHYRLELVSRHNVSDEKPKARR